MKADRPPEATKQKSPQKKGIKYSGFPCTDAGNGELFAASYGKLLRYDHKRKRWLRWASHWWVEDRTGLVMQFAKNVARYRLTASADIENDDERRKEVAWALQSESRFRLEAMVKLAQSEPPLADSGENWDRDPWLLGVANGVVDLRTGKLRDGKPDDRITMHTNVPFDPEAKCERWLKFLDDIFEGNQELIDYAQRCVGYSSTGLTQEQCVFNAYGSGANGKSTFLEAIRHSLGPYAGAAPFSMFERKNKASIPSDLAATANKRLITASETDETARLNESRIKVMTGGDKQSARFLYQDWFEFEPTAKVWLAFNHKPEIHDDSHGMWRRIRLIPFNRKFEGTERDRNLGEKLKAEAAGILAWAVRGCLEWQRRGLDEPKIVLEATAQYRAESDTIGNFIAECCEVGENLSVPRGRLWEAYERWASGIGSAKLSQKAFIARLESRGFKRDEAGHDRTRVWLGIGLDDADPLMNFAMRAGADTCGRVPAAASASKSFI